MTKKEKIALKAKEILAANPDGVRFSELVRSLREAFPGEAYGNFTGAIWNLDSRFPTEVYKPSRGLFRLTSFKTDDVAVISPVPVEPVKVPGRIREANFYEAFANYLVQDLEECAYRLFAHKSYLVIPRDSQKEDVDRLDALCVLSGIGLILFDSTSAEFPDFQIRVRASKHEPDAFHINSYQKRIADALEL